MIMQHSILISALLLATVGTAWLPGKHVTILAQDGTNLFFREGSHTRHVQSYISEDDEQKPLVNGTKMREDWLPDPGQTKHIRGVNAGSLFVFEPWLAQDEWNDICGNDQVSEFDCGLHLGQDGVNQVMQNHWNKFFTQDDISQMTSLGLNTLRIPVGYWMREDLIDSSEPFPRGGLQYMQRLCGWASDAGMYIIIDLHGAPGAQVANNADTGQHATTPGFYDDYNYERALKFLEWMANLVHTTVEFRNVGMLEVVNEPVQEQSPSTDSMRHSYYANAFARVRAAETVLNVSPNNYLHIQMMDNHWGSGDPTESLPQGQYFAAFDNHRYLKWSGIAQNKDSYMATSCSDDVGGNWPVIVGEFSLSAPDDDSQQWTSDWDPNQNVAWYLAWFSAQARAYEKQQGWIFWTWKSTLGDPRWSYKDAVALGIIPRNLDDVYNNGVCQSQ